MSIERKRYCVFGCAQLGAYMHSFPHPERRPDMFEKWVSIVGNKLKECDPWKIYKSKKICDYHFTSDQKVASHRLIFLAVPCQYLDGVFLCSSIAVQQEHNYCMPGIHTSNINPKGTGSLLQTDSTAVTIDDVPQAVSNPIDPIQLSQPSTSQMPSTDKDNKSLEHAIKNFKTAQKELRKLKNQLNKTKKNVINYKSRLANAEKALSENSAFNKITKNMTLSGKLFTGMQYRQALKNPKGRRYNTEEKVLALSIYKKSPKCYSLLSKYFKLPSSKSLKNLLSEIKIAPGINKTIFEKIKDTVGTLNIEDRLCTLIFDEMSLEPHIQYDSVNDQFKGFINHSNDLKIANHALVFMIKGIKMNFKQPVAYYFTQSLKTIELKNILKDVIRHVHSTGLKILCTVCDQGATNVSTINSLVNDTKEHYLKKGKEWPYHKFTIDGNEIVPLYDVPHLLKGIRNNLLTKDLKYTDFADEDKEKIVKWQYFEMIYEADKTCGELRYLHKLTEEHILPKKIKKMRVKMAAQVFSHSVAVTTDHLTARNKLPEDCRQLIPFVLTIDKLFDSLNAGTFHIQNGKIYRAAVKKNSPHHKLWQDSLKTLKTIKYITKKRSGNQVRTIETSAPSIKNFIKTIEGVQILWNILNKKYSLNTMLTRNFNQDPVENFFGNIRSLGVRNIAPNCQSFEGAFKTLLLNNFNCKQAVNANCEQDFNKCLQTLKFLLKANKKEVSKIIENKENIEISQEMFEALSNVPTGGTPSGSQKNYVCGWVLTKCLKKVVKGCKLCKSTILATNTDTDDNAYIRAKEFHAKKQWLCYPSNRLSNCFSEVQDITTTYIKTNFHKKNVKENICQLAKSFVTFPCTCETHKESLQNCFIETTVNLLLFSWCRSINRILSGKITNQDLDDPIKQSAQLYYNVHKHKK